MTGAGRTDLLTDFFKNLGFRLGSENGLSDMTYAILKTIPEFARDFVSYFVGAKVAIDDQTDVEVIREYVIPDTALRIDFAFFPIISYPPEWMLLLENKLWDQDYHFQEYKRSTEVYWRSSLLPVPNLHFGLIVNHKIPSGNAKFVQLFMNNKISEISERNSKSEGWEIRLWSDFLIEFENNSYGKANKIFRAYLEYVRQVCRK